VDKSAIRPITQTTERLMSQVASHVSTCIVNKESTHHRQSTLPLCLPAYPMGFSSLFDGSIGLFGAGLFQTAH
jgi:hypothetical protein